MCPNGWSTRPSNLFSQSCLFGLVVKLLTRPGVWGGRGRDFHWLDPWLLGGIWLPGKLSA